MQDTKLLMIINEFPPTGLSGVQRALKFLKYVCLAGWEVHAVVPTKPVRAQMDPTLLKDIPDTANVHRIKGITYLSKIPSRSPNSQNRKDGLRSLLIFLLWKAVKFVNDLLFSYDKQIFWAYSAYFTARRLIEKHDIRNVYITAYPYSSFLVGLWLKRHFGSRIFWIADYRDAWQFAPLMKTSVYPFRFRQISRTDDRVLKTCDHALFVTDSIRAEYIHKHPWLESKSSVITNGYDEEDFAGIQPTRFEMTTFVYMGRIDAVYGSPITLLEAIRELELGNLQFIHLGSIDRAVLDEIRARDFTFYEFAGYQSHQKAISAICGADVNVIMINDDRQSEGFYTGKLFELLRAGRPILSLGPERSVIKDLLIKTGLGLHARITDKEAIKAAISALTNKHRIQPDCKAEITRFSRQELAAKLMRIYNQSDNGER